MLSSEIDISVIIVNYNVKDLLLQCLRSIQQAAKNISVEIIVIDNHSSDGSVNFLKPLFPSVEFISLKENIGFGRANNIGIEKAKGRYILILNPDTILEEETLEVMRDYMEAHPEVGIAGCKVLNPDGTFQLACRRGFPTPWSAFCKLFGLQKLFPKSRFFAKYNQTFKDINESYNIDAVVGAFMFCRKEVFDDLDGFDPDFFMYAEDIDLCYRASKNGWKIAYVHSTSIIHYKGESTKRSSINEVKHFYKAMEIYSKKHFSGSSLFLFFIRFGIFIRTFFAYLNKNRREIFVIIADIIFINLSLLLATMIRFGDFFNFPDYAYPTVFITLSAVVFSSMIAVGAYFESNFTIRKSFIALMMSFFFLSSLTYFFKEYAFSRGVLLMTIGFGVMLTALVRSSLSFFDKLAGKQADRRIAIAGINDQAMNIINSLRTAETRNADIIGFININEDYDKPKINLPVIGSIEYLPRIIEQYKLHEIIITDPNVSKSDLIGIISKLANPSVRFHIATEYEDLVASKIVNEISGIEPTVPQYNITKLRFRLIKRLTDIAISLFFLSIGLPMLYLLVQERTKIIKKLWLVLKGEYSFIGLYQIGEAIPSIGKIGIIGLAHISKPDQLSRQAVEKLNEYYIFHYSLSLDLDIFLKFIFRKKIGN